MKYISLLLLFFAREIVPEKVNTLQENQQSYYDEKYPLSPVLIKAIAEFVKH